ncbi:MAG TPA: hypothetical protein RMH80_05600, partial [Polyangiaceae bacterium LLY-WYZ-15_(1-7)]|nr:hypothetical protein [Polyangiaceae bacterium LLY-WYZ-15_(1-7)]
MALKRRSLFRSLGLGAAALSLPALGARRAKGADDVPKRVIFFYGGSGSLPGSWEPLPAGGA